MLASVTVRVPATSANLGPGFDCLGVALTLYNHVTLTPQPAGLEIEVMGEGAADIPRSSDNLVYRAAVHLFEQVGRGPAGLRLHQVNGIPVGAGLGSSSAAIVGGLVAANALVGTPLTQADLLTLAAGLEGHPDNVAPALYGGLMAAWMTPQEGVWAVLRPMADMPLLVVTPAFQSLTRTARALLPARIPHQAAVANVGRLPLLLAALAQADYTRLPTLMEDDLHQPYRLPHIPGLLAAYEAARQYGAAVALSGAGPSLLVIAAGNHHALAKAIQTAFAAAGVASRVFHLRIDHRGAHLNAAPEA